MKLPRRRRTPDPSRPGTVYRSKPQVGRPGRLSGGPPYLNEGGQNPARGGYTLRPDGGTPVGGVGAIYEEHGGGQSGPGRAGGHGRSGGPGRAGGPPYQPYGGGPGQPPPQARGTTLAPRPRRFRLRPRLIVLLLVLVLIGYPLLLGLTAWTNLNRVDALSPAHEVADTADTPGRNYLVVGSDSRSGLTKAQRRKLGTGSPTGKLADTIILLHVPSRGGQTVLVSVPRDSYVPIPGHGSNKINAAFSFGGPALLVRTVEQVSGVRIDEYVQTGLGGFADIVDAIGGVTLCPKRAMNDKDAHINLKKGCQEMDGKTALGYARARKSDPLGDLGRVQRQRETLAAIAGKTLSPGTLVQPWRSFPAAKAGGTALTVDEGTTPVGLARFVLAMRAVSGGGGLQLTVPVANPNFRTPSGASAVKWDTSKALVLFNALKQDDTDLIKPLAAEQAKAARLASR